jgi:hypothetical protein
MMSKRDVITTKVDLKDFLTEIIKESLHSKKRILKEDEEKEALKTGDVSVEEVIDKLNTIRAGKSFKSEEIKASMESYLNDLNSAEKTALFAFLKGIAQVVGGDVEGSKAIEPEDSPANVKMEKKPTSQKVTIKPVVIKKPEAQPGSNKTGKEDTTPPAPIVPKKK